MASSLLRGNLSVAAFLGDIAGPAATVITTHPLVGDIHIPFQGILNRVQQKPQFRCGQAKRSVVTSSGKKSVTHYYDVLGLTPEATQSQIKSAYYQMSKLYHPDIAKTSKTDAMFREVTEAYEVLGNLKKRRMYDKGFRMQSHSSQSRGAGATGDDGGDYTREYWSSTNSERGTRPPPPRGRSNIYNFDEFYRMHYNDVRERRFKERMAYEEHVQASRMHGDAKGSLMPVMLPIIVCLIGLCVMATSDPDVDKRSYLKRRRSTVVNDGTNQSNGLASNR